MSVGPLGGAAGSAAGSPLAQTKSSDVERAQQDDTVQQRQIRSAEKAESASGIGETDGEDHDTAERDADGRRLWEGPPAEAGAEASEEDPADENVPRSKDVTGQSGHMLDLSG
jgi:hypothetical protein